MLAAGRGFELIQGVEEHDDTFPAGRARQQSGEDGVHVIGPGLLRQRVGDTEKLCQLLDKAAQHGRHLRTPRCAASGVGQQKHAGIVRELLPQLGVHGALARAWLASETGTPGRPGCARPSGDVVKLPQ